MGAAPELEMLNLSHDGDTVPTFETYTIIREPGNAQPQQHGLAATIHEFHGY